MCVCVYLYAWEEYRPIEMELIKLELVHFEFHTCIRCCHLFTIFGQCCIQQRKDWKRHTHTHTHTSNQTDNISPIKLDSVRKKKEIKNEQASNELMYDVGKNITCFYAQYDTGWYILYVLHCHIFLSFVTHKSCTYVCFLSIRHQSFLHSIPYVIHARYILHTIHKYLCINFHIWNVKNSWYFSWHSVSVYYNMNGLIHADL